VDVLASRRRDQHPVRTRLEMRRRLLLRREEARALEDDVDAEALPRQLRRVALLTDANPVAGDDEILAIDRDFERERPVRRVIAGQMRVRARVAEIVDRDDRDLVRSLALVERAQDVAPDAAVTVDRYFDRHVCLSSSFL